MTHLLAVAFASLLFACGGPPSTASSTAAPTPADPPVVADSPAPDASGESPAPLVEVSLPVELGPDAMCLGFLPSGEGGLFITRFADRTGPTDETTVAFVMRDDQTAPPAVGPLPFSFETDRWAESRSTLAAELVDVSLVACVPGARDGDDSWVVRAGGRELTAKVDWTTPPGEKVNPERPDDAEASTGTLELIAAGGSPVAVAELRSYPFDGGDHESLGGVFASADGETVALVVHNADSGLSDDRVIVLPAPR